MSTRYNSNKVRVENTQGNPLYVTYTESGNVLNTYSEANSVAGLASADVVSYTVPVGKILELIRADVSGTNKAEYKLDINASVESKKRTYFTNYNESFETIGIELVAGDIVKIIVENKTNSTADFNANIIGRLENA